MKPQLVLASRSPRRRALLEMAGVSHICMPSQCQEVLPAGLSAEQAVLILAKLKAMDVAQRCEANLPVLGADTLVVLDGRMLGKPSDTSQAEEMLHALSGAWHQVMTGLCLMRPGKAPLATVEITRVHFINMTDRQIHAYAATGDPLDKAGGYGIQGMAGQYIDRIEGCYYNVVGLPLARLGKMMEEGESVE